MSGQIGTVENKPGAYTTSPSTISRHHIRHEGLMVIPSASGAPILARLHDPYETEVVEAILSKIGKPPDIPAYNDVDANRTFVGGDRLVTSPAVDQSLTQHQWHVAVTYNYVLTTAAGINSEVLSARLPADNTVIVAHDQGDLTKPKVNIPSTHFITGVLGKPFPSQ